MEKNFRVIIILTIILVLLIISFSILKGCSNNDSKNVDDTVYYVELGENYRQNTSSKLKETKKIKDLDIVNMGISYKDNKSKINLKVENNTSEDSEDMKIKVNLLNSKGEVISVLISYIPEIEAGGESEIIIIDEADLTNTYDYEIFEY